jgi:hypothetical protein
MARYGMVYRLFSLIDDKDYVGSTWDTATQRLSNHITHYKQLIREEKSISKSLEHFTDIGWNNVKIDVLEEREFDTIDDRLFCERDWIELLNPSLNTMKRPRITEEERKEWSKQYYNRPEIKQHRQEYMKAYNAEYREKNLEAIREAKKDYREKNQEKIRAKRQAYQPRANEIRRNTTHHCVMLI